jgi:hypothetical protein
LTHQTIREARAVLLSRRGEFEAAVSLAREALALADETDDLETRGWQRIGLAETLAGAGEAIELFEAKGHLFGADEARRALKELREPAASERASAS